ncbi:hypothetical protein GQ600_24482 [Phytophthora cactorum]|nr:hypothetical protein GQ600_24482 [Phytophthora cactorum]
MIFAVSFSTRPLDYFLPPPAQRGDGSPQRMTPRLGDLEIQYRQNTYSPLLICAWRFPESTKLLLHVFAVVHAASLAEALDHAPQDPVHATINLYTYGFTKLFEAIREYNYAPSLVPQTRGILSHYAAAIFGLYTKFWKCHRRHVGSTARARILLITPPGLPWTTWHYELRL